MPKGKRRAGKGKRQEEDIPSDDTGSVTSVQSETSLMGNGALDESIDETSVVDNSEDQMKDAIEELFEKSAKSRLSALNALKSSMRKSYCAEFLTGRRMTVSEGLIKCLRRGGAEEQVLAAECLALLLVQMGEVADSQLTYQEIHPILTSTMTDPSANLCVRAAAAQALGMCCFIGAEELEHLVSAMNHLHSQFKGSLFKGDQTPPSISPELASLHAAALGAWTLLVSILPRHLAEDAITNVLPKLSQLLSSKDLELRCVTGEAIAVLYEQARAYDEEFSGPDDELLCATLRQLATDGTKSRAKRDRRQQRASFRDILRAVEDGCTPEVLVKVTHPGGGQEHLELNSWAMKLQYETLCDMLAMGCNVHLRENEFVRDTFDMGPAPLPMSINERREQKAGEKFENAAAFKQRTKIRAKVRDKRFVHLAAE